MSIDVDTEQIVDTHIITTINLKRNHILEYLRREGINVPHDADIFMEVPMGGDWSGENLQIEDAEGKSLHVRFERRSTERKGFTEKKEGTP